MKKLEPRILFRNLLIEIIIYSVLVFAYYWFVLRYLDEWLMSIFESNLVLYAFSGLGLIITQAVLLYFLTSFLLKFIRLDQFGIRRVLDVFSNR
jgi:hypothetical protein